MEGIPIPVGEIEAIGILQMPLLVTMHPSLPMITTMIVDVPKINILNPNNVKKFNWHLRINYL
jgi:hypothetical protein